MGATGALGALGAAVALCGCAARASAKARVRAAVRAAIGAVASFLLRAIGLERVVVRVHDEARPAAAAALEPESGRSKPDDNHDEAIRRRASFLNMR